jgi:ribose-phosphate pyrophosphokinase
MSLGGEEMKVIIGSANPELGRRICEQLGIDPCKSEVIQFSEGNTFVRVLENVRGRNVFVIQGISYPVNHNFMELLFWVDALKLASANQVTAVIPFFSYAKGDKKDEPRVSIRSRVCADALEAAGVDRILSMELHSAQIQGFFKRPVDHLHPRQLISDYFRQRQLENLVVASADVGYGKSAFKYAELLQVPTVIGNKIRRDHSEKAQIWNVVGEVKDRDVLIVDDIVFTGSSLISMAHAVKKRGAKRVFAAATHGVLTHGAAEKLDGSPIEELIVTDTVEYRFEKPSQKVKVLSVAKLFADAIHSIHHNDSVSRLFPD